MLNWRIIGFVLIFNVLGTRCVQAQSEMDGPLSTPLWSGDLVSRESVIPLQWNDRDQIVGRLAFPAAEILDVRAADGSRVLESGSDVTLSEDGRQLIFTPGDALKYVKESQFFPAPESPMSYRHRANHPDQWMLYSNGGWFHQQQVEVTYRKREAVWQGWKPTFSVEQLPRSIARLKSREALTIGFSGDSITAGGDASRQLNLAPHMPAYPELLKAALESHYGHPITVKNRAVGGWSVANGVQDLEALLAEKPDLIVVAYGMNDVGRRDPDWFGLQTKIMVDRIQAANSKTEIVLVAPMIGNQEWVHTPRDMFDKYRDQLVKLTGPGVVLADLTSVWAELLKSKHDYDLIGNGLNHPNDFGHRLYAQAILGLLMPVE